MHKGLHSRQEESVVGVKGQEDKFQAAIEIKASDSKIIKAGNTPGCENRRS